MFVILYQDAEDGEVRVLYGLSSTEFAARRRVESLAKMGDFELGSWQEFDENMAERVSQVTDVQGVCTWSVWRVAPSR